MCGVLGVSDGYYLNDMFNDKDTNVCNDKHVYVGFGQNGRRCGDGTPIDTDTLDHYESNFLMEKYHGRGNNTFDITYWLIGCLRSG